MPTDLRVRHLQAELMDDPRLDARSHHHALRGLARINRVSNSAGILWPALLRAAARVPRGTALRVLDLASGGGDVPIALARRALRAGLRVTFHGCDVSARAVQFAQRAANEARADAQFFPLDVLRDSIPAGYDVITSSLFLHHLSREQAIGLLRRVREAARLAVLVNDLRRSAAGHWIAWAGTRVLSRCRVVHVDGPRSVRAAFSLRELGELAGQAGMHGARVSRRFPWRMSLEWEAI